MSPQPEPETSTSTSSLMRSYCASGDAEVFRKLVERFLPLVLGAAMRRSGGDRALAEDIAQLVFTDFAKRMPELRADDRIGGWLYRAAFLKAGDVMKSERRRKRREQLAATMQEIDRLPDPEGWRVLSPVIDEAMQDLGESDREVLVLRFFEGKRLDAVAAATGTSTAAVQKRVERALQRLRAKLNRAGVTGSATVLAGLISTQSRGEASAATVERIASGAGAAGGAATAGSLISLPLIAVGAIVGIGIGSLPLLTGGATTTPVTEAMEYELATVKKAPGLRPPSAIPKRGDADLAEIVDALGELFSRPLTSLDRIRADDLLGRISGAQAGPALELMESRWTPAMLGRIDEEDRRTGVYSKWALREPEAALDWLLAMLRPGSGAHYRNPQLWGMACHSAFTRWAFKHRSEAWAWAKKRMDGDGFETDPHADVTTAISQMFGPGLVEQLGKEEGIEALLELQELSARPGFSIAMGSVLEHFETEQEIRGLLDQLERSITSPEMRVTATGQTLRAWAARDWRAAIGWVAKLESEDQRTRYGWTIGLPREGADFDIGAHFRWLGEIAPRPDWVVRSASYGPIMDGWFAQHPGPAADWLMDKPEWLTSTVAYNILHQLNTFASDPEKDQPADWREHALRLVREVTRRTGRDPQTFTRTPVGGSLADDQESRDRMRRFLDEVAQGGAGE